MFVDLLRMNPGNCEPVNALEKNATAKEKMLKIVKAEATRKDTRAPVRGAPDTLPSVRRKPSA